MEAIRSGDLVVHVWPAARPDAPVAVAAHGITANGLSFGRVAEALDGELTLVAPDLRGRAGSREAPGPYGLGRHAEDLVGVLDTLGVPEAVLVGHSMGAWVAATAAVRHPARTTGVVLIDGGLTLPLPPEVDIDATLAAVLGPALARLGMTFETPAAYLEFWRAHPAFADEWSPRLEAYLLHDLVGDGPYRSSCVLDAIRTDGGEVLLDPEANAAIHALPVPGVLLYAERGLLDQPPAMYDADRVAGLAIPATLVPDTNHYTILMGDKGTRTIADRIRAMAG
jgi:pimeloyl-ACP methyl ester carboxylesterase